MRKSAAMVIVPLAVVSQAEATSGATFVEASFASGGYITGWNSGGIFTPLAYTASALPAYNNITGTTMTYIVEFSFYGGNDYVLGTGFGGNSITGVVNPGTIIPTSYSLTFSTEGTVQITSWTLQLGISEPTNPAQVTGSGAGTFSETVNLVTGGTSTSYFPNVEIAATGAGFEDVVRATMTLSYNVAPIPEPATYGLLLGVGALGLVAGRRRRAVRAV